MSRFNYAENLYTKKFSLKIINTKQNRIEAMNRIFVMKIDQIRSYMNCDDVSHGPILILAGRLSTV